MLSKVPVAGTGSGSLGKTSYQSKPHFGEKGPAEGKKAPFGDGARHLHLYDDSVWGTVRQGRGWGYEGQCFVIMILIRQGSRIVDLWQGGHIVSGSIR